MASPSPKPKSGESFFEKLGTIARRKKVKEAQEIASEGKNAIESPTSPTLPVLGPEGYQLGEFEERSMIEKSSKDDNKKLNELMKLLVDWINDELADQRIIVKDLEEDLFDGQILQKLIECLARLQVEMPEVTQSEIGQKQKLSAVLGVTNNILQLPASWNQHKWSVDSVHSKNLVAILHLLVALARHFRAPIRLPEHVTVSVIVVQKVDGQLQTRHVLEEITGTNEVISGTFERDAFDTLFDHAPDKLNVVKRSLINFASRHLNKINLEVTELESQFHDGVYFVLLVGLLEGYFVPLYSFHLTPTDFEQKVHNVNFAFQLMMDAGLPQPKARAEDIVNLDLKSTLRILYNLFTKYKGLE
ncbi:Beta-parvin [Lamellibrachia satsuma]|nr:Beta-parvin [Lamellibrachia satsuma]